MTHTTNINLNLLYNHQIHKEFLLNENAVLIDAMLFNGIKSSKASTPPEEVIIGDKYIVPQNATGQWTDRTNQIAVRLEDRWSFVLPKDGMLFWLIDEEKLVVYSKSDWKALGQ